MDGPTVAGFQPLLVFYPRHLTDAQRIIQAVRENQVVVLITRHAATEEAQRLIDYACGGMEALDGQVHRIDAETFLFAPAHARVEG
jgi:cell division inhibitor SepF